MNSIKAFLKEKGLYLFCLALVFAATVAGILALRTIVQGVRGLGDTANNTTQEEQPWSEPNTTVNNPAENVPKNTQQDVKNGQGGSAQASSSGAASQSGAASEAVGGSAGLSGQQGTSVASPWGAEPVAAFSGDDLVYQETLGDWRTHNGADYAVKAGDKIPPVKAGTVTSVYDDALWGGVVEVAAQDGTLWRYCGLTDVAVKQDDKVGADTALGTAGSIPAEQKSAHLHVECTKDAVYLDPEKQK